MTAVWFTAVLELYIHYTRSHYTPVTTAFFLHQRIFLFLRENTTHDRSPLIVPGFEFFGSVAPRMKRPVFTTSNPSHTYTTQLNYLKFNQENNVVFNNHWHYWCRSHVFDKTWEKWPA